MATANTNATHTRDVVVMGASAGGLPALKRVLSQLPADFNAAVLVVLHISIHTPSMLDVILDRCSPLRARKAVDNEVLQPGTIYVAPTDRHLVIENQRMRLTRGPRENHVRPCIDVLFRSAALEFRERVIGVLLTGALDDGTAGLWAIKDRKGLAIVQDPEEAEWDSMPLSALQHVEIDHTLKLDGIAQCLQTLTAEEIVTTPVPAHEPIKTETLTEGSALEQGVMTLGEMSPNTCPECHGSLVRIHEGPIVRYRCHTGHAFSLQTLLAGVDDTIDDSLWSAMRAIEERAFVLREMQRVALEQKREKDAQRYDELARLAEQRAQRVRNEVIQDFNSF